MWMWFKILTVIEIIVLFNKIGMFDVVVLEVEFKIGFNMLFILVIWWFGE